MTLSALLSSSPLEKLAAVLSKQALFRPAGLLPQPVPAGVKLIRRTTPGFEMWIWDDGRVTRHWRREDAPSA